SKTNNILFVSWEKIFLGIIFAFPICDIITGFLIFRVGLPESFIGSPSQLIRIIFILFGLSIIPYRKQRICVAVLLWILAIESLSLFYTPSFVPFISGLNYGIKLLYIVLFYFGAEQYCAISHRALFKFQSTIFNVALVYALGVIIPTILGFGEGSYGEGTFGQKGLLSSGNAIGIFLGIMNCLIILKKKSKTEYLKQLIISISLIFLATKTALLLFLLGLILILIKLKPAFRYLILIFILAIIVIYMDIIYDVVRTVADVILFRFDNRESLFSFLMSSRDAYVSDAITEFMNSPIWILKFFIGGGAFMSFRSQYTNGMVFDTLENEFFDIFFMYGIIGLVFYLGAIVYFFVKIEKKSSSLGFIFLLFCLHSILAGHILFDGIPIMSAVLIIQIAKYFTIECKEFNI
ncbi:O-antigen ligase family protein, partial [uncultured Duncaniella sp.]